MYTLRAESRTFDLVSEKEISPDVWQTYETWHLDQNTTEILHLGRDEYEGDIYQATMTWDEPIPYLKLPIADYAGTSWSFETFALMPPASGMDSLHIEGTIEIEDFTMNLTADYNPLNGTFNGCYVHHLYGEKHPVAQRVVMPQDNGPGDSDTLYVYDWEL